MKFNTGIIEHTHTIRINQHHIREEKSTTVVS
jgi:hypothetical protein